MICTPVVLKCTNLGFQPRHVLEIVFVLLKQTLFMKMFAFVIFLYSIAIVRQNIAIGRGLEGYST